MFYPLTRCPAWFTSQSKSQTPLQTRFTGLSEECHLSKRQRTKLAYIFIVLNMSAAVGLTSPSFGKGSSSSGARGGGARVSTSKPVTLSKPPSRPSYTGNSPGGGGASRKPSDLRQVKVTNSLSQHTCPQNCNLNPIPLKISQASVNLRSPQKNSEPLLQKLFKASRRRDTKSLWSNDAKRLFEPLLWSGRVFAIILLGLIF